MKHSFSRYLRFLTTECISCHLPFVQRAERCLMCLDLTPEWLENTRPCAASPLPAAVISIVIDEIVKWKVSAAAHRVIYYQIGQSGSVSLSLTVTRHWLEPFS